MHLISGKVYQKEVFAVIFRNIFQGQFTPKGKVFANKQPHQVRHRFSPVFQISKYFWYFGKGSNQDPLKM